MKWISLAYHIYFACYFLNYYDIFNIGRDDSPSTMISMRMYSIKEIVFWKSFSLIWIYCSLDLYKYLSIVNLVL